MKTKHAENLIRTLENKEAVIGVIGLGYVGLPLCLRYLDIGFSVVGFDVDDNKTKMLSAGESYIQHIDITPLKEAKDKFKATTDYSRIQDVDAIVLCLPTPLTRHREPDLSYVLSSLDKIVEHPSSSILRSVKIPEIRISRHRRYPKS